MTIGNDDQIRAFLADEVRREVAAAPSLEEAVGRLAPRVAGRPSGASQRLIVLLAATLLLVAALGTAIAVGSGILRLPLVVDSEEPSVDLGIFAPVAGQIVYCTNSGLWAVDPSAPSPTPTPVRLEGTAAPDGQCASFTGLIGWSSDGTELLFQREDLTDQGLCCPDHLYILRADGTETQLNSDGMYLYGATISPDGSRVVFAAGDYRDTDVGLFVVDAEGGQPVRIAQGRGPTFSPDGTQIAYVSTDRTGPHVWVANADGSDAHEILADEPALAENNVSLAWSPAGDRIAMDIGLEGHVAIYTFAPDGSDFTEVIIGESGAHWSPDGSQIAYGEAPLGLSIANADGSNIRTFGFGASGPWHPGETPTSVEPSVAPVASTSPAPDATEAVGPSGVVAYSVCPRLDPADPSACTGDSRIWVVNDDGTGARELRPDEPGEQQPIIWSPDGSELLYSSDAWGVDLAITDAAGSAPEVLPNESLCPVDARDCLASLHDAVFSPDGERLAYAIFSGADGSATPCTGGCGGGTIAVLEIATGQVTRLDASRIPGPTLCCDGYYEPSWSADGTRLAFAMPPLTSFTINVDGSGLRQLVPAGEGEFGTAPRWSPDGSTIASSVCGTRPTIYLVQPDGGDLRTVGRDACDPRWTRDGRIVFSRYYDGPASDWIMDADGGNVRRLDNTIPALTAAGCIVCTFRDGDGVNRRGLWQPVPTDQP